MRKEEIQKFLEKARGFFKTAQFNLKNKRYDLAAFHIEQAIQFMFKTKLLELIGDFPKIHDVIQLANTLQKVYKKEEMEHFMKDNLELLSLVNDAYILARYYTREYTQEEVKKMLDVAKKVSKLLGYEIL